MIGDPLEEDNGGPAHGKNPGQEDFLAKIGRAPFPPAANENQERQCRHGMDGDREIAIAGIEDQPQRDDGRAEQGQGPDQAERGIEPPEHPEGS